MPGGRPRICRKGAGDAAREAPELEAKALFEHLAQGRISKMALSSVAQQQVDADFSRWQTHRARQVYPEPPDPPLRPGHDGEIQGARGGVEPEDRVEKP
jgi:hypothetical protein